MDHEYFWKCIQHEFGEVHLHLQNILRIQSLCNQSLALLTRESIMAIENDMRGMADRLVDSSKKAIYGAAWESKPKEFRFLEGEILCLLGLAEHVRNRGVEDFLKFSKGNVPHRDAITVPKNFVLDQAKAEEFVSNLKEKIKSVYSTQQTQNDPEYNRFIEKLDNLDVQWLTTTAGKELRATVACPVCASEGSDRRITLKVDKNGRWFLFSFTRHCDTFHYVLPRSNKRKQFTESEEIDDGMDDSVSDPMNLDVQIKVEDGDNGPVGYFITS